MTDPSLYRDDSRVRHMLDAMERIAELSRDLVREQLRRHEGTTEMILFNLMVLGEAANNISREFASKNPDIDWKGLSGVRHKIVHDYADIDYDTMNRLSAQIHSSTSRNLSIDKELSDVERFLLASNEFLYCKTLYSWRQDVVDIDGHAESGQICDVRTSVVVGNGGQL